MPPEEPSFFDWLTGGAAAAAGASSSTPTKKEPSAFDKIIGIFTAAQQANVANQAGQYQVTAAAAQAAAQARTQQMLIIGGVAVVGLYMIMKKD
jgi:dihydrofolate reductase